MTLSDPQSYLPIGLDQIAEIRLMAEGGRFGDALLRVRKVKSLSPPNTFLIALEKQLERLMALPIEGESTGVQQRTLIATLPTLLRGVTEVLQTRSGSMQSLDRQAKQAGPMAEKSEKEKARLQLKEQYFRSVEEHLRNGAYGSALVEVHRVKIIAPEDPTSTEYERIIRQLVELKQREAEEILLQDFPRTGDTCSGADSFLPQGVQGEVSDGNPRPSLHADKPAALKGFSRLWNKLTR
jgi:hypothetical protein